MSNLCKTRRPAKFRVHRNPTRLYVDFPWNPLAGAIPNALGVNAPSECVGWAFALTDNVRWKNAENLHMLNMFLYRPLVKWHLRNINPQVVFEAVAAARCEQDPSSAGHINTHTPTTFAFSSPPSYLRIENAEGNVLIAVYLFIYLFILYLFVCVLLA